MKRIFYLSLIAFAIITGCKDEPTDPCDIDKSFKANFVIGEMIKDSFMITDTISNPDMLMTAVGDGWYKSYRWTIGDDPREFTTQKVKLSFADALSGRTFSIRLIAERDNAGCSQRGIQIDTIVKKFTVAVPKTCDYCKAPVKFERAFIGKWRGSLSNAPNEIFDINIVDFGRRPDTSILTLFWGMRIYNLPKGCGGLQGKGACGGLEVNPVFYAPETFGGYRNFTSSITSSRDNNSGGCCYCCNGPFTLYGSVDIADRNKISVTVKYKNNTFNDSTTVVFRGNRL